MNEAEFEGHRQLANEYRDEMGRLTKIEHLNDDGELESAITIQYGDYGKSKEEVRDSGGRLLRSTDYEYEGGREVRQFTTDSDGNLIFEKRSVYEGSHQEPVATKVRYGNRPDEVILESHEYDEDGNIVGITSEIISEE